jgi:hypothetical protein
MRTKTLQEQFNLINEGKGHKDVFLKEAKRMFPNKFRNAATFEEASKKLLHENVISIPAIGNYTSHEASWESAFKNFIAEEAKAVEKKPSKEVEEAEEKAYDTEDVKEVNNQIFDQYMKGLQFESTQAPDKTLEEVKAIVEKNLAKNPLHYMQEAAFGLEGVGYEEMPTSKSDQMVPVKESSVPSLGELLNEIEEGEGAYEYEKGKKAGEEIEKKKMKKSAKKESIETKLAEIEKQGKIVTMEAQMDALDELIASKSQRVEMIGEDENLAELVDKKKMKAMQKEISLLEKRKEKMGKMYEKMAGKAYAKKEVVDEMDAVKWDMQNGASMDTAPRKVGPGNVDGPAASSEQSKNA